MRIAIVQESIDAARGGAETSTREMAAALVKLGAEVTLVLAAPQACDTLDPRSGVRLVGLAQSGLTRVARCRNFLNAAPEFTRAARFDIVHAIVPIADADVYQPRGGTYRETIERSIALGAGPLGRGIRRLARRLNLRQQCLLRAEGRLLGGARPPLVAALSQYVARQVCSGYPHFPPERVRTVFNGVAFTPLSAGPAADARARLRTQWQIDAARPVGLFVAHNFRLKGLATLLQALALDPLRSAAPLLIVAGRDAPDPYARLARTLDVASQVRFVGAQTPVATLLAAADALIHPTWYDPCSRVVLEALIAGVPVVTTSANGASEAIGIGRQGFVIDPPDDAPALAVATRAAFGSDMRASSQSAAIGAAETLSMHRHARELLALYATLRPTGS